MSGGESMSTVFDMGHFVPTWSLVLGTKSKLMASPEEGNAYQSAYSASKATIGMTKSLAKDGQRWHMLMRLLRHISTT